MDRRLCPAKVGKRLLGSLRLSLEVEDPVDCGRDVELVVANTSLVERTNQHRPILQACQIQETSVNLLTRLLRSVNEKS